MVRRAVREHLASEIVGIVENGFAFLAGQPPIVVVSHSRESFADAQELLNFLSYVRVHYSHLCFD